MPRGPVKPPRFATVADLVERLGGVAIGRIRLDPTPGTATVRDLIRRTNSDDRLYELVDGTLVEKPMGYRESEMAGELLIEIGLFLRSHDLGIVTGADGTMKLMKGLVRVPDVAFVSWASLPGRQRPTEPVPDLAPDLAVEVLSESNTRGEMDRKLKEYFLAGTTLVWYVDPVRRAVRVYAAPDAVVTLTDADTLDGGSVLPGFRLALALFFDKFGPPPAKKPGRRGRG